jgi:ankyrin repeat protein
MQKTLAATVVEIGLTIWVLAATNVVAQDNNEALIVAAKKGNLEEVKSLLEGGVDVNALDAMGYSALWQASFFGRDEVAKFLLEGGADINARDNSGRTPLSWVSEIYNNDLVNLLKASGAKE